MVEPTRPRVNLLSSEEVEEIIGRASRVLETIGVSVENREGADLLREAGCEERDGRILIPEKNVLEALESAPPGITVFDRDGEECMDLAGDAVHFDPGSAAIHVLDPETGRRRQPVTADVIDLVRLVDRLPNYAAQSTALVPGDVPEEISDRYRLYLALKHGTKPVITGTFGMDGFPPMLAMLAAVRSGGRELQEKPLAIFDCCPSPPLRWSELTCRCLVDCARAGVPVQLVSMPLTGATSPVTLRDAVVQHCAENLSGVVLTQLAGRGAPVIYGGAPSAFDMRHGTTPMGAVETMMIGVAYSSVGKRLGLPTHGYLGLSDAKTADYQAGMESGVGAVLAALAGINVVSGPGILDYILTQSLEKLLLDHESCGMALRLVRGIDRRKEDPVDLIGDLVSTGEFLSHDHTRRYWREELSVASGLIDRDTYGDWEAKGSMTALDRAREEVRRNLSVETEPVAPQVGEELDRIMLAEACKYGLEALPS